MNERISSIKNSPYLIPSMIWIGSFSAGAVVGYLVGKRGKSRITQVIPAMETREDQIAQLLDGEIEELDVSDDEVADVVEVGRRLVEERLNRTIESHQGSPEVEDPVPSNIFANEHIPEDQWDYEAELAHRAQYPDLPYVIHKDEFYEAANDYSQNTLVYYEGDDVVCDEDNTPVYNHSSILGPMQFGHGSGDLSTFYVRNDKLKAEYEICYDPGLFTVEVMGLEIEDNERTKDLKHSRDRRFKQEE